MNPYDRYLSHLYCTSLQQLYIVLEGFAISELGLEGAPFHLSALEHPPGNIVCPEIHSFIVKCAKSAGGDNSEGEAIKFIKFLKVNPPKESYEYPKLGGAQPTKDEANLIKHIFYNGIDLPGSMHNPFGHLQHFSSFFIDMFFGNYTEFNDHIKTLSKEEVDKALKKREGYCQYSPIFAPILGIRMVDIERRAAFTSQQIQKIRILYSGYNENEHLKILKKLVKLGADVKDHDINGFTPLHHAVYYRNVGMVAVLLKHGANPNAESRITWRPLSSLRKSSTEPEFKILDNLLQYNARITDKRDFSDFRTSIETYGTKELAVKVREAHPRDKEECEKCVKPAPKKCGACGLVYYCTPACQKLDWKFHKITCQKNKRNK